MSERPSAGGIALAGLSICESLLISLVERGLFDAAELEEILESARETNLRAENGRFTESERAEAAAAIRRILVRCQSARHDPRS